jgi:hypothetical protein
VRFSWYHLLPANDQAIAFFETNRQYANEFVLEVDFVENAEAVVT